MSASSGFADVDFAESLGKVRDLEAIAMNYLAETEHRAAAMQAVIRIAPEPTAQRYVELLQALTIGKRPKTPEERRAELREEFEADAWKAARYQGVRERGAEILAEMKATSNAVAFDILPVEDIPDEPVAYSIDALQPIGGNVLLIGQFKAGKTGALLNAVVSRTTGADFLGRFASVPITGRAAYLNYELQPAQFGRWARGMDVPADKLLAVNLRGRRNPFSVSDDMRRLGEALQDREVELVLIDPFANAFKGCGPEQNNNTQVGDWWDMVAEWAATYGIREFFVAAHAGRSHEGARGASALEDKADAIWTLTKGKDARYFRATGRDVELDDDALVFDPATKLLTLAGTGGRASAAAQEAAEALLEPMREIIARTPGINLSTLRSELRASSVSAPNDAVSAASAMGELRGLWSVEAKGKSKLHTIDPEGIDLRNVVRLWS